MVFKNPIRVLVLTFVGVLCSTLSYATDFATKFNPWTGRPDWIIADSSLQISINCDDSGVPFADGDDVLGCDVDDFHYDPVTGYLYANAFVTGASNTPRVDYFTNLASDTKWTTGVPGDGGNDNDDSWVLSEGTTLGSSNRISVAPGGAVTFGDDLTITGSDLSVGAAGVKLTGDGDGAITFLGLGDGSDEDLTINLDDTSNVGTITSSTSLSKLDFSSIDLQVPTEVYDSSGWNGDNTVPTKDAVRDKIEALGTGGPSNWEFTLLPNGAVLDDTVPPEVTVVESTGTGTARRYYAAFDAAADEILYWSFILPADYTAGSLVLNISWYANSTTANADAIWAADMSCTTEGDADSMLEDAAGSTNTASENVNTTEANRLINTVLTLSNTDSGAPGDYCTLRFFRDADDSVGDADNDGLSTDAKLLAIRLQIPRA